MASSLTATKQLASDTTYEVIVSVNAGGTLPLDIFIYENTGLNYLGDYQGVCDLDQYQRYRTFEGQAIKKFSNKYLKYTSAKINVENEAIADQVIAVIVEDAKKLSVALTNYTPTTNIINIP